jgi:hypothetical protein
MMQFQLKFAALLLLWKNNIPDFTVNVQENSDPRHPDDYMLVTDNNNDGCEVEQIGKRCRPINDSDQSLKRNYATHIGVISLTCSDALFEGICNYLQTIKDVELLKCSFICFFKIYIYIYIFDLYSKIKLVF